MRYRCIEPGLYRRADGRAEVVLELSPLRWSIAVDGVSFTTEEKTRKAAIVVAELQIKENDEEV